MAKSALLRSMYFAAQSKRMYLFLSIRQSFYLHKYTPKSSYRKTFTLFSAIGLERMVVFKTVVLIEGGFCKIYVQSTIFIIERICE